MMYMIKKIKYILFVASLFAVVALVLLRRGDAIPKVSMEDFLGGSVVINFEEHIKKALPMQGRLLQIKIRLGLLGGSREQNDIFITNEGLIKNISSPVNILVEQNTNSIVRFAGQVGVPTYITLIPTASAILQQQLPAYAKIHNNQKLLIDNVYRAVSGKVTAVDAYSPLFYHRDEYLYYRTENNLTALGGFYLSAALGSKMGLNAIDLSQYDIDYLSYDYYGDLYKSSPYQDIRPDVLSAFRYRQYKREYLVSHLSAGQNKVYHTLFPQHLADIGREMDVYMGGISAITDITSSADTDRTLLVFGDKTAIAYLPFLANYYKKITLVDLFQLTAQNEAELKIYEYHQILFAYSVESYDSDLPRRAEELLAKVN